MRFSIVSLWFLAALVAAPTIACQPLPSVTPPVPDASDAGELDAGDEPQDAAAATCASVCKHEAVLGCAAAKPTPKGATCAEVCANRIALGIPALKPKLPCKQSATSCSAVDACDR